MDAVQKINKGRIGTIPAEQVIINGVSLASFLAALQGSLILQANWNAATNTPDISAASTTGHYWIVNEEGTTDIGGITDWKVNDWAVKTATGWAKVDNTESFSGTYADLLNLPNILSLVSLGGITKRIDNVVHFKENIQINKNAYFQGFSSFTNGSTEGISYDDLEDKPAIGEFVYVESSNNSNVIDVNNNKGKVQGYTSDDAITLTINKNSLALNDIAYIDQMGAGVITFLAGTGNDEATLQINPSRTLLTDGQFSRVAIHKVGVSTYRLFGELKQA